MAAYPRDSELLPPNNPTQRGGRFFSAILEAIDPAERQMLLLPVKVELAEVYLEGTLSRPRGVRESTKEKIRIAASLRADGLTLKQIGKRMKVTEARVSRERPAIPPCLSLSLG
jgi:DNA invertase Pin-like site-specific DNA recombinase